MDIIRNTPGVRPAPPIRTRPFGWITDIVLSGIERDPARLRVWLGASRAEWHFAAMVFALARDDADFTEIEEMLFARKKKDVLHCAAPEADLRLVRLAAKLTGRIWRPRTYRKLAELMEEPRAAKLLLRSRSITRRRVAALGKVPAELRLPAVFERLERSSDADKLVFAVTLVERIRPDLRRAAVLRSLAQTPKSVSLETWARRHFREASFPDPPWKGTAKLKPLMSFADLHRFALRFRNCIRSYARDVFAGSAYLYVYDDGAGTEAVVEFVRVADDLWIVDEINGPANEPLSKAAYDRVVAEASAAALTLPESHTIYHWVDPAY